MTQSNPDVEITGESILQTPAMKELFERGKTWITKHWEKEGRPTTQIQVKAKTIGRNAGFIMEVSISNPVATVKYFAKIQRAHMDTVMTHYLLKYTNSGPDVFLIVPLENHVRDGRYGEGVITMEVPNFKMASILTKEDKEILQQKPNLARSQFFLITLLNELGHFGNIPGNKENWGYASDPLQVEHEDKLQRLVLVDFSSSIERDTLESKILFCAYWCHHYYRYGEYKWYWKDFSAKELRAQTRFFPWLRSACTFTSLLQKVMHRTETWLMHAESIRMVDTPDTMDVTVMRTSEYFHTKSDTNVAGVSAVSSASTAFDNCAGINKATNVPKAAAKVTAGTYGSLVVSPHMDTLFTTAQPQVQELLREYVDWVGRWNRQCEMMFKWMPSKRSKVKYTVQVHTVKVKFHLRRRHATYQYRI